MKLSLGQPGSANPNPAIFGAQEATLNAVATAQKALKLLDKIVERSTKQAMPSPHTPVQNHQHIKRAGFNVNTRGVGGRDRRES